MLTDPWSVMTATASSRAGRATSQLDRKELRRIRPNVPVMDHGRRL